MRVRVTRVYEFEVRSEETWLQLQGMRTIASHPNMDDVAAGIKDANCVELVVEKLGPA
jgi:hypothetical protein